MKQNQTLLTIRTTSRQSPCRDREDGAKGPRGPGCYTIVECVDTSFAKSVYTNLSQWCRHSPLMVSTLDDCPRSIIRLLQWESTSGVDTVHPCLDTR
ncbi:hypothetical protein Taro_038718 [Colocasia esculenta]|uniref:Uncharacterized protein n=1 Tax=Colocasia esculenta TaxID=4460 RepID=A0A843WDL8_COLES|nr:hypothetical protein [Colocasia esculenta]